MLLIFNFYLGFFRTIWHILIQKEQPSGAGVMVVMLQVWHWQRTNRMCLSVVYRLPPCPTGSTMVSYCKAAMRQWDSFQFSIGFTILRKANDAKHRTLCFSHAQYISRTGECSRMLYSKHCGHILCELAIVWYLCRRLGIMWIQKVRENVSWEIAHSNCACIVSPHLWVLLEYDYVFSCFVRSVLH